MGGLLRNTSPWFFKHLFTLPFWVQSTNPCKIWQWFQCILPTYVSLREHFMWMPQNTFNDKSTMVQMMDYKPLPQLMLIQFYITIWHHWTRISWQHIDGLVQVTPLLTYWSHHGLALSHRYTFLHLACKIKARFHGHVLITALHLCKHSYTTIIQRGKS